MSKQTWSQQGATNDVEWALTEKALDRIDMHHLVKSGVATYQQLGIPMPGGVYPIFILEEHLAIDGFYNEARNERARLERMKGQL